MLDIHALTAVLVAGHCRDDLGGHGTCHLKALGRLDHLAVDGSVVQHVLDIDQTTVEDRLDEIIPHHGNATHRCHVPWQYAPAKQTSGNITGHFTAIGL